MRGTLALAINQPTQTLQVLRTGLLARQPHHRGFGQSPRMQRLPDLLMIERSDSGAMVGAQHDDLLMGQLRQHPTHVTAANAEHLRQAFFGKATGRIDALFKNGVEDSRVEIIRRRGKGQGNKSLR
jgi:hypothetical protein